MHSKGRLLANDTKGLCRVHQKYKSCQESGHLIHLPPHELQSIHLSWSFPLLGMDIVRPSPSTPGQCWFLLVAVGYFTKWIEEEPLTKITTKKVHGFI